MKGAYEHMGLTARSYDRILRVAGPLPTWTAASPSSPTTWRRPSSTASRTTSPPEGGAPTQPRKEAIHYVLRSQRAPGGR